jgi:phage terminase large subunit-like protein
VSLVEPDARPVYQIPEELEQQILALSGVQKLRLRWKLKARPAQVPPTEGDWLVWMNLSGRGTGKTRAGAEDSAEFARSNPATRQAIVAPTFAVGRDVCVEGFSGLLTVLHKDEIAHWNRSEGQLVLKNGSSWKIFSSSTPDRLRGPQFHRAWCEEMASWEYLEDTWNMLMFGLRLGHSPKAIVTTTPKPYKLIKDLAGRPTTMVVREATFANAENLSPIMLDELRRQYEGTLLGRQELYGEIIDDVEGALWRRGVIEDSRGEYPNDFDKIAVAVDPSITGTASSDECGIVVVGRRVNEGFVLDDLSRRASPEVWAQAAVQAYLDWEADALVYETNQGHELVASTLKTACGVLGMSPSRLNLVPVNASRGKRTRAEPIAVMYTEQGGSRIHHPRAFPELEDQMCTWVPGDPSPDRLDALVWGLTHIMDDGGRRKLRFSQ